MLLAPATAGATTYCVAASPVPPYNVCPPGEVVKPDPVAALAAAAANAGRDRVRIRGGVGWGSSLSYSGPDPVDVFGDGSGPNESRLVGNGGSNQTALNINRPGSTVSRIRIEVGSGGTGNVAFAGNATLDNVVIGTAAAGDTAATGARLLAGGRLLNSVVDVSASNDSQGLRLADRTEVRNSRIVAGTGVNLALSHPASHAVIARTSFSVTQDGVRTPGGSISLSDSLVEFRPSSNINMFGLWMSSGSEPASIDANHLTLVGPSAGTSKGVFVQTTGSTNAASATLRNTVITGFATTLWRAGGAGGGPANLTTDYSSYPADSSSGDITSGGNGTLTQRHLHTGPPGFVGAGNYDLAPGSSLIDAGAPGGLAPGEPPLDLAGRPRLVDAAGHCIRRRDIGAYEFQRAQRAPFARAKASPATVSLGRTATFDGRASCDPDADVLAYLWRFDDGSTAAGPVVRHAFKRRGRHFGTLTVTDPGGLSRTATAAVTVRPSTVAKVATQTVRAKKGKVRVTVRCPAAAVGRCKGTLTLTARKLGRIARHKFSVKAGKQRKVKAKLSKKARSRLRRGHRIKAKAKVVSRDDTGKRETSTGKVTIKPS